MSGPARLPADDGFSLVETIVALGIVGAVMTSVVIFFVGSGGVLRRQADSQAAVQLAAGAMDYASQLPGENLMLGRTQTAVETQLATAKAAGWRASEVGVYVDDALTAPAYQDPGQSTTSSIKTLPTTAEAVKIDGDTTPYERWWFVGRCWQPKSGGACTNPANHDGLIAMLRIVVAIKWPSPDCPGGRCEYATAMLTEADLDDPTWK
ncbi:type II secretion system protein [Actinoplanes sp. NPDC051475]|uniref:type II secretion system protein n=1 Tax=Actinoplanes sp. NPDC051475 TaxID=3157225 RepID=UPI00344D524A